MNTTTRALTLSPLLLALLTPLPALMSNSAHAQSIIYCCDDADGGKQCGDFLPKACQKRAYEERDDKGYILKKNAAPLTAAQQAQRDAEVARKADLALKQLEEKRRSQALLSTYANEQEIDKARDRALADADKAIAQAEKALGDASKAQATLSKEQEFYKGKPLPAQLKNQLASAAKDVQAKTDAVSKRSADKSRIAAEFEQETIRFRELKGGKVAAPIEEKPKREVIIQAPAAAAEAAAGDVSKTADTPPPKN
jgi:hypothetical protein